jgi:hypothetical protein
MATAGTVGFRGRLRGAVEGAQDEARFTRVDAAVCGVLTIASALLRVSPMGPSSLWVDDAWQALVGKVGSLADVWHIGLTAKGFSLVLSAWLHIFGLSSWSAQALPFLLGVAGPPLLYVVARHFGLSRVSALLAAGLLLVSPGHMTYSSRVKPYTADALLAVLLLDRAHRVLTRPFDGRRWIELSVVGVISVFISAGVAPVAAAAVGAGVLAAFLERRAIPRVAVVCIAGLGAFAAVWWVAIIRPAINPALHDYWNYRYIFFNHGLSQGLTDSVSRVTAVSFGFSSLPKVLTTVLLLGTACVVLVRRPAVGVLLVTPTVLAYLLAVLQVAPLGDRTDIYLYPSLALLAAIAFQELPFTRPEFAVTGAAVLAVAVAATLPHPDPYQQEDIRPLVAQLWSQLQPGDAVIVYPDAQYALAYYSPWSFQVRPTDLRSQAFEVRFTNAPDVAVLDATDLTGYVRQLRGDLRGYHRVWFIVSHPSGDVAALKQDFARLGYIPVETVDRPGSDLELLDRAGSA